MNSCDKYLRLDNPHMYIIVRRHVKDRKSLGDIVKVGLQPARAREEARRLGLENPFYNYWAMPETRYRSPWSE